MAFADYFSFNKKLFGNWKNYLYYHNQKIDTEIKDWMLQQFGVVL
jgi:hypothetical protein